MEKTIFLFRRHKDRSPEDFARHYIGNHAPLGARLTRCLEGYTVNIVEGGGGPDAVTEHWVPAALDLLTPEIAYATPGEFQAVWDDDRTLFDGFELYVVVAERVVVAGAPLDSPLGAVTPEGKAILMYAAGDAVPAPPVGARRVVDNVVGYRLEYGAGGWGKTVADIGVMRMVWGADLAGGGAGLAVREYRFIAAPDWEG